MTPQEAIEIITNAIQTENMTAEQDKALAIVQKATDKQISKKLLYHCDQELCYDGMGCIEGEELFEYYECPKCGYKEEAEVFEKIKYCPECGQALDWGDEE